MPECATRPGTAGETQGLCRLGPGDLVVADTPGRGGQTRPSRLRERPATGLQDAGPTVRGPDRRGHEAGGLQGVWVSQ